MKEEKFIYLDNAATTAVSDEVMEAMRPYFTEKYGNPSSIYNFGQQNKQAVIEAREKVANALGADANEIYFTGSGTEADNWAIRKIAKRLKEEGKGNHIITSALEHHAVLHVCQYLEKNGFEVTYLGVDEEGFVSPEDLEAAITDQTILITIMFANNEIGTINPIKEIGQIAKDHNIIFHTDAVQAAGILDINVKGLNIDLLSLSAHKINGPKGVGALYCRKGIRLDPFILGGAQEKNKRAGTENVPGIVGFGVAMENAAKNAEENRKYLSDHRDYLIEKMLETVPFSRLNGPRGDKRLPNNTNFSFKFIEGEGMLLLLDHAGIAASSGSACTSGSLDPSHCLLGIGLDHETAHGSLRLTLDTDITKEDLDYVVEKTAEAVERLRQMSPLYNDYIKENK